MLLQYHLAGNLVLINRQNMNVEIVLVYVIAWVAVKFGINTTSVALEMEQISRGEPISNTTRVVFIPNFHCYTHAIPC